MFTLLNIYANEKKHCKSTLGHKGNWSRLLVLYHYDKQTNKVTAISVERHLREFVVSYYVLLSH